MSKENKKILMIENDVFFLKLYRDKLIRHGYEFSAALNGIEGLHKVENEKPDLIILDLMLPMKNGFDVLKEIKSNPKTKNIPVIILTNLGQESDIREGLALGAADYLVKATLRLSEVVDKIKFWLDKK